MKKLKRISIFVFCMFMFNIVSPNIISFAEINDNNTVILDNDKTVLEEGNLEENINVDNESLNDDINETLEKEEKGEENANLLDITENQEENNAILNKDSSEIIKLEEKSSYELSSTADTQSTIISKVENPVMNHNLTDSFQVKGYAISKDGISKVEIFLDNNKIATATYGIQRDDVASAFPDYPNSKNSGFKYNFTNVSNGKHEIKIRVIDSKNNTADTVISINVNNSKTKIMGTGSLDRVQMINILRSKNTKLDLKYIVDFVDIAIKEAKVEGINHDILFSQMMHETGYLKFGGDVKPEQNNFAGIGATGNGNPGYTFESVEIGIRAVVQHLKAYASTEPLKQDVVDPRFKYVTRGTAIYLEHLGIPENPEGYGWATARGYGYNILNIISEIKNQSKILDFSVLNNVTISGKQSTGSKITVTGNAIPAEETLYRIWVANRDTDKWTLLSDWSTKNTSDFYPDKSGNYSFVIHVKHKNSKTTTQDHYINKDFKVDIGNSTLTSFSFSGYKFAKSNITLTAKANPESSSLYQFKVYDVAANKWTTIQDYSSKNTAVFTPEKAGNYKVYAYVKHKDSSKISDDSKVIDLAITNPYSKVTSLNVSGNKYVNQTLTMTASADPSADTLYKLWVCDRSTDTWTVLSDWSTKNTATFMPKKSGTYSFVVHVKHKNSGTSSQDAYKSLDVNITAPKSTVSSLTVTGNKMVNETLTMTASGTPSADTLYKLWVCDRSTDTWTVLSDWSTKNTATFMPKKSGTYSFVVHVKHKNSGTNTQDAYKSIDVQVSELKSTAKTVSVTGDKYVGSTVTMTATADPSSSTLYKLWVCDRSTDTWTVLSDWSTKNTATFVPTKAGIYSFVVHVKHKNSSTTNQDSYKSVDINIQYKKSTVKSLNLSGNNQIGQPITMTATADPSSSTLYKLWVCDRSTDTWTVLSDWSTKNTASFTPTKKGYYSFVVHVKNKYSNSNIQEDYMSKDIYAYEKDKATAVSLDVTGTYKVNNKISINALAEPQNDAYYKIWICDRSTETWTVLSDWGTNRTASFTPKTSGTYSVVVHVKHKNSKSERDDYISKDISVKPDKTLIVIDAGHNYGGDSGAEYTHNGITYNETSLNMQVALKLKQELISRGFEVIMTREESDRETIPVRESLEKRVKLANSYNADLFVSIHHNSNPNSSANGVEVYYSSATPLDGTSNIQNGLNSKIKSSKLLAENMVNNIATQLGYYNRGAKDEEFYVVKNTLMPSVLVECGFISNPSEAKKLADQNNQLKLAKILADQIQKQY